MSLVKKDFRKNLKYLKDKRKDVIDSITKICSINAQHAKLLTEALFEEFREAKIERKLSLLFLMDSILKNCKEHYQDYLEEGISEAFCDAYEASMNKQEIRKSLRLLFKTWEPHFSGKTIMSIVTNIKLKLGEDINTSLSEEELDSLIEYYRKNGIDPSHLLLQKQILQKQQQETKKPVKREIVEEESLLYVPPDIKAVLGSHAPTDKKLPKPAHPRTEPAPRSTSGAGPVADVIRKRPEGDGTPHKKSIDSDHSIKRSEGPPVQKRPEAPSGLRRPEGAPMQRRAEGETPNAYTIKKKRPTSDRDKPPLDRAELELNRIRKTVKSDRQPPPEAQPSDVNGRGGYGALNRRLQEPMRGPAPTQGQRGYFEQQPNFEEITQVFSDEESGYASQAQQSKLPREQPQRPFPHQQHPQGQSQFQQHQSQYPSQSQVQQPQHLHQQHNQPHFQQQQPQSLQSQQQQPHLLKQHPQSQFPQQSGPMQPQSHQMHPHQPHQFPLQGQFHGQSAQRTGPGSDQQQQQHHDRYPFPFPQQGPSQIQQQQQQQYRHPIGQEPPGRGSQLKEGNNLSQIKKFVEQSLKKEPDAGRSPMEVEPLSGPTRIDSFPDPRTMRKSSDTPVYDQGSALVFKEVLQGLKREMPRSIKAKYEYKLNRMGMGSLSNMVGRRDFRIVESLYEDLLYRCSSCGLRFSNRTLLNKHLDWHFQFNMELKEKTKTMNLRPQMITTDHWIRDEGNKNFKTANIENGEDDFEFENYVPSSEQEKSCKACGEAFKEVWDKDKETWLLDTATKVKYEEEEEGGDGKQKSSNYDLMHFRCYKLCLQIETK